MIDSNLLTFATLTGVSACIGFVLLYKWTRKLLVDLRMPLSRILAACFTLNVVFLGVVILTIVGALSGVIPLGSARC